MRLWGLKPRQSTLYTEINKHNQKEKKKKETKKLNAAKTPAIIASV